MEFMLASEGVEADEADEDWPCGGRGCIGGRGMLDAAAAEAAAFGGMGGGVADDDESDEDPELPPLPPLPTK